MSEYGPRHDVLMEARKQIDEIKKLLNAVARPLEGMVELHKIPQDKRAADFDTNIATHEKKRDEIMSQIQAAVGAFPTDVGADVAGTLKDFDAETKKKLLDKETYGDWQFMIRRWNSSLFTFQKNMLAEIKKIKADFKLANPTSKKEGNLADADPMKPVPTDLLKDIDASGWRSEKAPIGPPDPHAPVPEAMRKLEEM
eukprot:Platyproteum_vivax@DN4922_c0_g1_i1.p1